MTRPRYGIHLDLFEVQGREQSRNDEMAVNARKMCKVSCVTLKKNLPAVVFLV